MAVNSGTNINCAYPPQQKAQATNPDVTPKQPAFKGNEDNAERPAHKKSKTGLIIAGLLAAAGTAALIIFRKNIFKTETPLQKLIKNTEKQVEFGKTDFINYVKENHAKAENFRKSFVLKLGEKFKTEHNIKETNNLLLFGYYIKGKAAPILTKIVDCEKIGKDLKVFIEKTNLSVFKGKSKEVI